MNHNLILLIFCNFFLSVCLFAQNVGIGTTTPEAKVHIKGAANASQLVIDANGSQANTNPLIKLRKSNGTDLLWIHSDDTTNTFVGLKSGRLNNVGGFAIGNTFIGSLSGYSNTLGYLNTANGYQALYSNTIAAGNTAVGSMALYSNTTGHYNTSLGASSLQLNSDGWNNTAIGYGAMYYNTLGGGNAVLGYEALKYNTEGGGNTAIGRAALLSNTTGYSNTGLGNEALAGNTTGIFNTAVGDNAHALNNGGGYNTSVGYRPLYETTNSYYNVAIGYNAGGDWDNGWNNVFIGGNANVTGNGLYNVVVIGKSAYASAASQARIGNSSTVSIGGYANWTNISDGRFKKNIQENVPGIEFITKLRPVTYTLDATGLEAFYHKNDKSPAGLAGGNNVLQTAANPWQQKAMLEKEKITYTGFIAQEVEAAAKTLGFDFSGVDVAKNENDTYGLRYAEFVVPLVKAVQEQQLKIVEQQQLKLKQQMEIAALRTEVMELKKILFTKIN